ncbi:MAG: ECF transporter S component [candidate division Zixibacteria bacterium]|nr:ECF transporter S component [candidate division Zixibacteria bacterium]
MKGDGTFAARVALFSALAYVAALVSVYVPNVSLSFVVIFASGVLFGCVAGMAVGGLGEFLWTIFNPLGMAPVPIVCAQVAGMVLVGGLGALASRRSYATRTTTLGFVWYALFGLAAGLMFQSIVNGVDTLLYGRSWKYLAAGLVFSLATIVSNVVLFPLCYPVIVRLTARVRRSS